MKNRLFILVILLSLLLSGCDKFPKIGDGYKVQYDGNSYVVISDTLDRIIIPSHVQDVIADSIFILVNQKPVDSICECNHECFKQMDSYDNKSYERCKQAFEKSTFHQYWIINKSEQSLFDSESKTYSNIYGPFSKEEYLKKRIEIGVPHDLNLVIEDESSQ